MNISTLWIQVLSYIAAAVAAAIGAVLGHTLTANFPDMPSQLSAAFVTIAAVGPGYFLHHYLDGLLTAHVAAIGALGSTPALPAPTDPAPTDTSTPATPSA